MRGRPVAPPVGKGVSQFDTKQEKETHVRRMFDAIAPRYDLLNRIIAANMDQRWRRKAARAARGGGTGPYLDVGAGTGDLTRALQQAAPNARVLALDLARQMLVIGRRKGLHAIQGSGLALPCRDNTFEAITNAFVLRNLADLDTFFRETHRALKPGGRLVSLEISRPPGRVFGPLYRLYFFRIMPRLGRLLSGDERAYEYLADSVARVATPTELTAAMRRAGYAAVDSRPMMRGAVVIFVATK